MKRIAITALSITPKGGRVEYMWAYGLTGAFEWQDLVPDTLAHRYPAIHEAVTALRNAIQAEVAHQVRVALEGPE